MRAAAGQAAHFVARLSLILAEVALALALLTAVGAGLIAWRLSSKPLESPWLAQQIELAANSHGATHIAIGNAVLTWDGFRSGFRQPLDLRLTDLTVTNAVGVELAHVGQTDMSLSPFDLVRGTLAPRAVTLHGAFVHLVRTDDGGVSLAGAAPGSSDQGMAGGVPWHALLHLDIRDAGIELVDPRLGLTWLGRDIAIDLRRAADTGIGGQLSATVEVGGQSAQLTLRGALPAGGALATLSAELSAINPAKLAASIPAAHALAALDAPVTLSASVQFDSDLRPSTVAALAEIGAGTLYAGSGHTPVQHAVLTAAGTLEHLDLALEQLDLQPRPAGLHTKLHGRAELDRTGDLYQASIALDLDRLAFADLPIVWPEGVGGPGARPWVVKNISDGALHDGHFDLALEIAADLSGAKLTHVAGNIVGEDVTIHWLRPVPPLEHVSAKLTLLSPDAMAIDVTGARQAGGTQGGLQVQGGRLVLSGFTAPEQVADIEAQVAGPVADLLTLLRHPRVKLLDRSPLKLTDASGQIAGKLTLTRLPLRDAVTMDDVQLRTSVKLSNLHVPGIAAGRDVDNGTLSLDADPSGLQVAGGVDVAGIPGQVTLNMDFRHGPPTQVTQTITASAALDQRQLTSLGLDTRGLLNGPADVSATLTLQRNGLGEAALHADLRRAALSFDRLGFAKPADQPAVLEARVLLDSGRITGIDRVRLDGPALYADGEIGFSGGRPDAVHVRSLVVGSDLDAHVDVQIPQTDGAPWVATLAGRSVNAAAEIKHAPPAANGEKPPPSSGPPYRIDAAFDHVLLAEGHRVDALVLHLESDGHVINEAMLTAHTDAKAAFKFAIEPKAGGRKLTGSATDAGATLRAFGVVDSMQGGKLTLSGGYDDTRADHLLTGKLEIDEYRLRNAPIMARLLQGMTLYGLVELTRGPGLGFTKLLAPFTLADDTLDLKDARAYSSSLGMTAKGQVDLAHRTAELQGTIVPAYFFNSLLDEVPVVGRLFSPESGGGVFAATYGVHGKLDDPDIALNPLAALTPGVLRQLFGVFDTRTPAAARP